MTERDDTADLWKYSVEDLFEALEYAQGLPADHPWRLALEREIEARGA